jgi:glycosyltransferase involved in cell wall biosynthesis
MIAQYVPWKRHHLFLDALSRMLDRPWHVVFAGADLWPQADYLSALRERSAAPPFAGRVSWLPWQEESAQLLSALDLCVLTSQHEPFGRVLLEAMACGTPVLAVDEGGVRDIIRSEETGCLTAADPQDIADAITRLLDDPARRASLGAAGRGEAARSDRAQRATRGFSLVVTSESCTIRREFSYFHDSYSTPHENRQAVHSGSVYRDHLHLYQHCD